MRILIEEKNFLHVVTKWKIDGNYGMKKVMDDKIDRLTSLPI